ncbi:wall-associated receptor kinase 3-like isoform X4 [Triticum dicoccoides]|uniref:wall-associated receptor kinase 3-like isoform X4 n=1 Tax=Triticum dicoccoides TaxID=85692 RepID=UPI001890D287|nr:wall-associated receptor kinase 3-like isoform X4 [Triticum dicoccoides]
MSTILSAISFVLMFMAAWPQASAAVSGPAGGILQIPSNRSLAHCITRCGDIDFSYPFGIGSGCFRQGFDLTCNHSTKHPKLFLGRSTVQVTNIDSSYGIVLTPIIFKLATRPGTNTYNMTWEAPAKVLRVAIMDQQSCEGAQLKNESYACSHGSSCRNSSSGGYQCVCSSYGQGNPYILDGCMQDYNPKPKEHCPASCGPITIPFPFGLEEGCFANEKFHLNCTSGNLTVSVSEDAQYQVTGISVEDGTLTVSNMVNGSNEKEAILIQTEDGYGVDSPMEDQFDFSVEYNIVIKWAVANLTCETAMQKDTEYACRSSQSYCLNVTHGEIFMGYRCKCSSGFQGNPYVNAGCTGLFMTTQSLIL